MVADYRERYTAVLRAVDTAHGGDLLAVLGELATSLYGSAGDAMP